MWNFAEIKTSKDYHFVVEEIFSSAVIEKSWSNDSETLRAPAIIVTTDTGEKQKTQEMVLELNKPQHIKSGGATLALLLTQQQASKANDD